MDFLTLRGLTVDSYSGLRWAGGSLARLHWFVGREAEMVKSGNARHLDHRATLLAAPVILLMTLSGCSTGSAQDHALSELSSLVAEGRDNLGSVLERSAPGQDLLDPIATEVGQDLRDLSDDEANEVADLARGLIGLDETDDGVLVEMLFVARGNSGGAFEQG